MIATHAFSPDTVTIAVRASNEGDLCVRFERALEDAVGAVLSGSGQAPVAEQVRWHFGIGCENAGRRGKRLRPRLLFAVARDEGAAYEDALDAALAVELLHNYSLVHDDIEDGDELRHGRQTVWARFGSAHGINAGDAMCAVSYLTLLRNSNAAPAERVAAMTRALHVANLAMCAGQSYDIGFESAAFVTMDAYLAMIEGKTAVLFGAACLLGALSAGADGARAEAYGELGRAYGRAFQIRDDVLGTWGSREETGKARGTDIAHRKWSFPIVWSLAGPPSAARTAIATRYAQSGPLGAADVAVIVAALDALDARAAAEEAWHQQAGDAACFAARHQLDRSRSLQTLFAAGCANARRSDRLPETTPLQ
jgi:geranylgeranyl diphosphate synthase type I